MSERAAAWARHHGFDLQVEAIAQRDPDSWRALVGARELYALVEAQASAVTKQEVEKLEGLLPEREELDDITLR
jgi:hypothetical protein